MDLYSFAPIAALLDAAYGGVVVLSDLLSPLAGSAAAALAIVCVTLVVRAALIPVGVSQIRAEITRRRLAPLLRELNLRHRGHPEKLQRATMELYTREKASPLAGCLPTLLQAPVLSLVYGLFILTSVNGHPNVLLAADLGGLPLGTSFVHLLGAGVTGTGLSPLIFVGLLAVLATVSWLTRRTSRRIAAADAADSAAASTAGASGPGGAVGTSSGPSPATMARLTDALSWLPFLTVLFAALVPLAATLYLTVSATWTLIERAILRQRLS